MKAIVQQYYGGPEKLSLREIPNPTYKHNEVLIEVHAVNVASGDTRINTFDVPFFLKPIMWLVFGFKGPRHPVRGVTASGTIVEVGKDVTEYQVGDNVYFINSLKAGCLAEYIVLNQKAVMAKIPSTMNFVEAAPLSFGAMTAYHFIHQDTVKKGDEVLIYGASGSVGSYALQLAKYFGATVTAVCSEKNHQKMKELNADYVIDYHTTDFREEEKKYDIIFDAVMKISKSSSKKVLADKGKYLSVMMPTKEDKKRLEIINNIVEEGKLKTLLDKVYPFEKFKEAHAHTYGGHKVGNVVIDIKGEYNGTL